MTPAETLRHIFQGQRCIQPASVFDPLSARAAARLGYEVSFLAGSVASLAVLGAPDLTLLTLSELAGLARRICRAGAPPLLVDADHGYGNALNARRTVEELVAAGAAGMTLEDTLLPTPAGDAALAMTSVREACGKLAAALDRSAGSDFVVVARTSGYVAEGIDAACARVAAYARYRPDAIFVPGLRTVAEVRSVAAAADGVPLMAYRMGEITPEADLETLGVRLLVMGHAPFANSATAAWNTLAIQCGAPAGERSATDLIEDLSGSAECLALAQRFLSDQEYP